MPAFALHIFGANQPKSAMSEHRTRPGNHVLRLLRRGLSDFHGIFGLAPGLPRLTDED